MVKTLFKNLAEDVSQEQSGPESSVNSVSGTSSVSVMMSGGSFLHDLQSRDKENFPRPTAATHSSMTSASGNCCSTDIHVSSGSFLRELDSVSSVSYAIPSASKSSVTSNSGNSSNTVMSSNSFLHKLQSFGGDIHAKPPAAHSSVTLFLVTVQPRLEEPIRDPQLLTVSPVFTCPPWHNSNPSVVVNLNNKISVPFHSMTNRAPFIWELQ